MSIAAMWMERATTMLAATSNNNWYELLPVYVVELMMCVLPFVLTAYTVTDAWNGTNHEFKRQISHIG